MKLLSIIFLTTFLAIGVSLAINYYVRSLTNKSPELLVSSPNPTINLSPSPTFSPPFSPTPTGNPSPTSPKVVSPLIKTSPVATSLSENSLKVQLSVPFTIQAPDQQWVEPWKEGCEEAVLLMADAYNKSDRGATLPVAETKQAILDMVNWQIKRFGSHKDIGVDEMAIVAKEYLNYSEVRVNHNPNFDDIRKELAGGKPVILPAAGQLLQNPYFKSPGPPYHTFLVTGFEGSDFITNENGTRRGRNYRYSQNILESAWHDWQDGVAVTTTPRAYLVLEK